MLAGKLHHDVLCSALPKNTEALEQIYQPHHAPINTSPHLLLLPSPCADPSAGFVRIGAGACPSQQRTAPQRQLC
jgi:hypothetical protein